MRKALSALLQTGFSNMQLQLVLTAVSVPFLLSWKLPFPLISILANLLYPLFLTSFLVLSSLLFFGGLCHVPCGTVLLLLEKTTSLWQWCLQRPLSAYWLQLSWWDCSAALAFFVGYVCLTHYTITTRLQRRLFAIGLCIAMVFLHSLQARGVMVLQRHGRPLICIPHPDTTIEMLDLGYTNHCFTRQNLLHNEVIPRLLAAYGQPGKVIVRIKKNHRSTARIWQECLQKWQLLGDVQACLTPQSYASARQTKQGTARQRRA